MEIDKFSIIDEFFNKAVDIKDKHGFKKLDEIQKVVSAIWHATGILENGGIRYLFQHDDIYIDFLIKSYDKFNMKRASQILSEAKALFPKRIIPKNINKTNQILNANEAHLHILSEELWSGDQELQDKLHALIVTRQHKSKKNRK